MKKILTSKRRAPEAVGQVSLLTLKRSQYQEVLRFHSKFSFIRPNAQTVQHATTTLTSKEIDKFPSSVSICPKRFHFIVLEQGSRHGVMNILLCSPSTESELTCRYKVWVKAVTECIPHKVANSLIMKKASINAFLGQWLQESSFSLLPNHYLSTTTQLPYTVYRNGL